MIGNDLEEEKGGSVCLSRSVLPLGMFPEGGSPFRARNGRAEFLCPLIYRLRLP